jgi:DNA modification methylase
VPTVTVQIIAGDCLDVLPRLVARSVHCCVTSPPYWGLRDYGHDGQIGLERTPEEYVEKIVAVFREVRRVLADDGTLWLNLGDCYATFAGKVGDHPGGGEQGEHWKGNRGAIIRPRTQPNRMPIQGLKPKDLVGIPWRVAFALQADGWYLRSDIIWAKPNPMPRA